MEMKFRHAAAIALTGWFLMMPPTSSDYPMGNVDAPLSQWTRKVTTYRNEKECAHVLDKQIRLANAKNKQITVKFYKQAQCVSEDDPRLKAK
jgi:hypothetical protein